jgi:hypothetical protein
LALAVFQAFSLAKLRISRLLSQKLKFWESLGFSDFFVEKSQKNHDYRGSLGRQRRSLGSLQGKNRLIGDF